MKQRTSSFGTMANVPQRQIKAYWQNQAIELGLLKHEKQLRFLMNRGSEDERRKAFENYVHATNTYGYLFKEAYRMNRSRSDKVKRIRNRLEAMVRQGRTIFVTFTFTDEAIANTTYMSRRQAVFRYCKSQSDYYVANRDYGAQNGREHFHALIQSNKLDLKAWHYGAINVRRIRTTATDIKRMSKYITKLTLHALKFTTETSRVIFSRKICDNKI